MSATARAEARRKAILARGSDRLSKLTTSARGDDPLYQNVPTPIVSRQVSTGSLKADSFLGEDAPIGGNSFPQPPSFRADSEPPPSFAAATSASAGRSTTPDPSVWSPEQQEQLFAALMGGAGMGGAAFPGLPQHPPPGYNDDPSADPPLASMDSRMEMNPLAALLGQQGGFPMNGAQPMATKPKPKTILSRMLPILHVITTWMLLAYFAIFQEPKAYEATGGTRPKSERWAMLARGEAPYGLEVIAVPFFYAFVTIQIVLHSTRIFVGYGSVQPPMLLSLALPHLPAPLPSVIIQGMKYMKMGSAILDDLALMLVTIGLGVWVMGLVAT